MINVSCAKCKCKFGMPDALYEAATHSSKIVIYCPYGHTLGFPEETIKPETIPEPTKHEGNVIMGLFKAKE